MTLHTGHMYSHAEVRMGAPNPDVIEQVPKAEDIAESVSHWLAEACKRDDVYYFAIFLHPLPTPIGQIMLHDINCKTGESLVGYHLFQQRFRGHGVGTEALRLLQHFVMNTTSLTKLVIITSRDNVASQSIAQKCGFTYVGTAREDQVNGMVFVWNVPRTLNAVHAG